MKLQLMALYVLLGIYAVGQAPLYAQNNMMPAAKRLAKNLGQKEVRDIRFQQQLFKKAVESRLQYAASSAVYTPTSPDQLDPIIYPLNDRQRRLEKRRYYQAMKDFAALKKDLAPQLFYIQTQNDKLTPAALSHLYMRITAVEEKLSCLALVFDDKPLQAARTYLLKARKILNPYAANELTLPSHLRRTDRKFVAKEFFLYGPDGRPPYLKRNSWLGEIRNAYRAKKIAAGIPTGMRIAFLNDLSPVEYAVYSWYRRGLFPKDTQLFTYRSVHDFERALERGVQFDLVITDLVMANGGGYALIAQFRRHNNTTPVLALSAFSEEDAHAQTLFDMGFDGMLSTHGGGFALDASGYLTLLNALNNYYQLKAANGWAR